MKAVCICSSFKFYNDVLNLAEKLKKVGVKCHIPLPSQKYRKPNNPQELIDDFDQIPQADLLDEARLMTLNHFARIDDSDVIYVIAPNGYVGKSVCMEVGYAYAKKKPIYCSEKLEDFAVMSLVDKILSEEKLIEILKT